MRGYLGVWLVCPDCICRWPCVRNYCISEGRRTSQWDYYTPRSGNNDNCTLL